MNLHDHADKAYKIKNTSKRASDLLTFMDLVSQGSISDHVIRPTLELLEVAEKTKTFDTGTVSREPESRVRDQGFRKAIVHLYNHRCALCGIRMLTPEGHTVVEAAHIVPLRKSQDDRPTNGMSLCRLCHWSFDEGLMSVGKSYEVLVSKRVQLENNIPAHILPLADRKIFTPEKEQFWPAQKNLQWHSKRIFTQ